MQFNKFLSLIILSIFLITTIRAATFLEASWQDETKSITINYGETAEFDIYASCANPPLTISAKLYNSGNLVYTFQSETIKDSTGVRYVVINPVYQVNQLIYKTTGNFEVRIEYSDAVQNTQTKMLYLKVNPISEPPQPEPDTIPPVTTDNYAYNNVWVNSTQIIILTPTDFGGSGLTWTRYCLTSGCDPSTGTDYTIPVSLTNEGVIYFRYASKDNAGNVETTHQKILKIDKTIPITTDNVPANWQNTPFNIILFTTNDGLSPITTYYKIWEISETEPSTFTQGNIILINQKGEYKIKYYSSDLAGNIETIKTASNTAKLDTTSPTINIINPQNTTYTSHKTQLSYTVTDNIELDSCWYSLNGGQNVTTECALVITGIQSLEGVNTWTVYANDTSGNIGSARVTFNVKIIEEPEPEPTDDKGVSSKYSYKDIDEIKYFEQFREKTPVPYKEVPEPKTLKNWPILILIIGIIALIIVIALILINRLKY